MGGSKRSSDTGNSDPAESSVQPEDDTLEDDQPLTSGQSSGRGARQSRSSSYRPRRVPPRRRPTSTPSGASPWGATGDAEDREGDDEDGAEESEEEDADSLRALFGGALLNGFPEGSFRDLGIGEGEDDDYRGDFDDEDVADLEDDERFEAMLDRELFREEDGGADNPASAFSAPRQQPRPGGRRSSGGGRAYATPSSGGNSSGGVGGFWSQFRGESGGGAPPGAVRRRRRSRRGLHGAREFAAAWQEHVRLLDEDLACTRAFFGLEDCGSSSPQSVKEGAPFNARITACSTVVQLASLLRATQQQGEVLGPSNAATGLAHWAKLTKPLSQEERTSWGNDSALHALADDARRTSTAMSASQLVAALRSVTQVQYTPTRVLAALYARAAQQPASEYQPAQLAGLMWASGKLTERGVRFSVRLRSGRAPVHEEEGEDSSGNVDDAISGSSGPGLGPRSDLPGYIQAWPVLRPFLCSFYDWCCGRDARLNSWTGEQVVTVAVSLAHQCLHPGRFLHHGGRHLIKNGLLAAMPLSDIVELCWSGSQLGGLPQDLLDAIAAECEGRMRDQLVRIAAAASEEEGQPPPTSLALVRTNTERTRPIVTQLFDEYAREEDEKAEDWEAQEEEAEDEEEAEEVDIVQRGECLAMAVVVQAVAESQTEDHRLMSTFLELHGKSLLDGTLTCNELAPLLCAFGQCGFCPSRFLEDAANLTASNDAYMESSYVALSETAWAFAALGVELPRGQGYDPTLSGTSWGQWDDVWLRRIWDSIQAGAWYPSVSHVDLVSQFFTYIPSQALVRLLWASSRMEFSLMHLAWELVGRLLPGAIVHILPSSLADFSEALSDWDTEPQVGTWKALALRVAAAAGDMSIKDALRCLLALAAQRRLTGDPGMRRAFRAVEKRLLDPAQRHRGPADLYWLVPPYKLPLLTIQDPAYSLGSGGGAAQAGWWSVGGPRSHATSTSQRASATAGVTPQGRGRLAGRAAPAANDRRTPTGAPAGCAVDDLSPNALMDLLEACQVARFHSPRLLRAVAARATALLRSRDALSASLLLPLLELLAQSGTAAAAAAAVAASAAAGGAAAKGASSAAKRGGAAPMLEGGGKSALHSAASAAAAQQRRRVKVEDLGAIASALRAMGADVPASYWEFDIAFIATLAGSEHE